ncbi:conserved hypothetical protein [Alicyclobacillus acidocaldarius subsp. acidocaldarius DSM 446]|uniref:DUF1861 family protein n=2 Tax=Alicyclobacillus acidocaldarius TaxID=405212 RepID=C8WRF0_ALIAD|nr:conserved hypothetical protein [Alicyclobacillus acidocaldarius subsp. acidocaldarius DSM 446]
MKSMSAAKTCEWLAQEYRQHRQVFRAEKIRFRGVDGRDVYNIAAPLIDEGRAIIPARVEPRDSEFSEVIFFHEAPDGVWSRAEGLRTFRGLQDPFHARIHGELVFGGVEIWTNPFHNYEIEYRTVFYRGNSVGDLRLFAVGPQWMKDIRLVELPDGRVGVFTRPNGSRYGGQAQIGWTILSSLDDLSPDSILKAECLPDRFHPGEWGGVNEAQLLDDRTIGVLGHIAYRSEDGSLHYKAMCFSLHLDEEIVTPVRVIAERSDFLWGDAKRPELADVVFSGGLVRYEDGTAHLYAGVSDAEAQRLLIPDPFAAQVRYALEMEA